MAAWMDVKTSMLGWVLVGNLILELLFQLTH